MEHLNDSQRQPETLQVYQHPTRSAYPGLQYPPAQQGFSTQGFFSSAPVAEVVTPKTGLLASMPNLKDISSFVERMGGIDGILATMTKAQKFMSTMQQMAPMMKLLAGSLLPGGKKAKTADATESNKKRRRSGKKRTTGSRRVATGKSTRLRTAGRNPRR